MVGHWTSDRQYPVGPLIILLLVRSVACAPVQRFRAADPWPHVFTVAQTHHHRRTSLFWPVVHHHHHHHHHHQRTGGQEAWRSAVRLMLKDDWQAIRRLLTPRHRYFSRRRRTRKLRRRITKRPIGGMLGVDLVDMALQRQLQQQQMARPLGGLRVSGDSGPVDLSMLPDELEGIPWADLVADDDVTSVDLPVGLTDALSDDLPALPSPTSSPSTTAPPPPTTNPHQSTTPSPQSVSRTGALPNAGSLSGASRTGGSPVGAGPSLVGASRPGGSSFVGALLGASRAGGSPLVSASRTGGSARVGGSRAGCEDGRSCGSRLRSNVRMNNLRSMLERLEDLGRR